MELLNCSDGRPNLNQKHCYTGSEKLTRGVLADSLAALQVFLSKSRRPQLDL